MPSAHKVNKRESDKFVRANSDSDDDDRDLKWSDAPDWTCPTWPGDVVPKDPEPWLKLIKGENLPTQRATLLRSLDAVCAWHLPLGASEVNEAELAHLDAAAARALGGRLDNQDEDRVRA